jgi:hypothetical protein
MRKATDLILLVIILLPLQLYCGVQIVENKDDERSMFVGRFFLDMNPDRHDVWNRDFYSSEFRVPGILFNSSATNLRIDSKRSNNWNSLTGSLSGVFDFIPYDDYISLIDQYYLNDLTLMSFRDRLDLKVNLNHLVKGDYFMKLNVNLIRSLKPEKRRTNQAVSP